MLFGLSTACELGACRADELAQAGDLLVVVGVMLSCERQDDDGVPVVVKSGGACRSVDCFAQVGGQVGEPRVQGFLVTALDGAAVSDTAAERVSFAAASDVVNVPAGERNVPVCERRSGCRGHCTGPARGNQ